MEVWKKNIFFFYFDIKLQDRKLDADQYIKLTSVSQTLNEDELKILKKIVNDCKVANICNIYRNDRWALFELTKLMLRNPSESNFFKFLIFSEKNRFGRCEFAYQILKCIHDGAKKKNIDPQKLWMNPEKT